MGKTVVVNKLARMRVDALKFCDGVAAMPVHSGCVLLLAWFCDGSYCILRGCTTEILTHTRHTLITIIHGTRAKLRTGTDTWIIRFHAALHTRGVDCFVALGSP